MRLYVRIEGVIPFALVLDDNLLPEHYVAIATQYYREHQARNAPDLVLIRRTVFQDKDQLLDFKRKQPNNSAARRTNSSSSTPGPGVGRTLTSATGAASPATSSNKATVAGGSSSLLSPLATTAAPAPVGERLVETLPVYDSSDQPQRIRQELVVTDTPPSMVPYCPSEHTFLYLPFHRLMLLLLDLHTPKYVEEVFLLTYRTFSTARDVLEACIQRFDVPPLASVGGVQRSPLDEIYFQEVQYALRCRVFAFLERWVQYAPFDFAEYDVADRLRRWAANAMDTARVPGRLLQLLQVADRTPLRHRQAPILPGVPKRGQSATFLLSEIAPREVATQLTLLSSHVHNAIHPTELIGRRWVGPLAVDVPNFVQYRDVFTRVSNWTSYAVVSERDPVRRTQNLAALLYLCEELVRLHNWDMVVAVHGGLTESCVARLKRTWDALPDDVRVLDDKITQLMSAKGSWQTLKEAMQGSARPHWPCIASYFRELAGIEELPVTNDDGATINFHRCVQLHGMIQFLCEGQKVDTSEWQEVPEVLGTFSFWKLVDDRLLMNWSLEVEPRATASSP